MTQYSEDKLSTIVCAAKHHDPAALAELYQYTYQHIYYQAFMFTGDPYEAEDLVQEGYIKCICSIDTLQNPKAFYSWMWTILKNIYQNQKRKQNAQLLSLEQMEVEENRLLESFLADDDTPETYVEKKELAQILSHMIHALPPEQREVIMLYYYERLTLAEIAEIQSCPKATVKSRLLYAKNSIQKAIQAEERRSGVSLHTSFVVPVLPTFFAKISDYIVLPMPTAIAIFTAVQASSGSPLPATPSSSSAPRLQSSIPSDTRQSSYGSVSSPVSPWDCACFCSLVS